MATTTSPSEYSITPASTQDVRIYVAPTRESLTTFQALCRDDHHRTSITELIFLSYANNPNEEPMSSRDFAAALEEELACGTLHLPADFFVDDEVYDKAYQVYAQLAEAHMADDELTYDVLRGALEQLPQLCKIGVQSGIDRPGLNDDRYFFARDYVAQDGRVAYCKSADCSEVLAYDALDGAFGLRRWEGFAAFFNTLGEAANLSITHLSLGNGLYDQLNYLDPSGGSDDDPSIEALQAVARNLTHLTLAIEDNFDKEDHHMWQAFLSAATNLRSLRVYLQWGLCDRTWHAAQQHGTMLSSILPLTFPQLDTFEVIGKLEQPTNIRAIWLKSFLERHANKLRVLELSGVLLVNWYDADFTGFVMSSVLRDVRNTLTLDSAKVLLHRRSEHANKACWRDNKDGSDCDGSCGAYFMVAGQIMKVGVLDALANELGVALNGKLWDFGEYVMRQ